MLQEKPLRSVAAGVPGEGKRPHAARPFLFLSDIHLSEAIPRTVAAFEHFIRVNADQADSVFILGDLFEYWIGDDMLAEPFVARMAALLHTLTERGIALYIMHGNRDFLLGKRFMKAAGAIWLPDPFVITAFGTRIAVAHGADDLGRSERLTFLDVPDDVRIDASPLARKQVTAHVGEQQGTQYLEAVNGAREIRRFVVDDASHVGEAHRRRLADGGHRRASPGKGLHRGARRARATGRDPSA